MSSVKQKFVPGNVAIARGRLSNAGAECASLYEIAAIEVRKCIATVAAIVVAPFAITQKA
jgi:hypothetical protein